MAAGSQGLRLLIGYWQIPGRVRGSGRHPSQIAKDGGRETRELTVSFDRPIGRSKETEKDSAISLVVRGSGRHPWKGSLPFQIAKDGGRETRELTVSFDRPIGRSKETEKGLAASNLF